MSLVVYAGVEKMPKNLVKRKKAGVPKTLEWEEFRLKEHVIRRLLVLGYIVTGFIMAVVGFMVWYYPDVSSVFIGAIITAAIGGVVKFGHFLVKQCQSKE
jgi:hypothetical protein